MSHATHTSVIVGSTWTELRALLGTGALQVAIQVFGLLTGLAALWLLPKTEFAYYTVATAMLGTLSVLTDCGVAQAVLAQGGKSWQNNRALGGVFASGNRLRKRLALVSALISLPALYVLLTKNGAPAYAAALLALSILPAFLSALSGHLLEAVLKLHQQLQSLQGVQLRGAALRLSLTVATLLAFPSAWFAIVGAGIAQAWATWRIRRLVAQLIDLHVPPDPEATRTILLQVKRTAPSAVYYALAGQLNVWLISLFGSSEAVADIGALGRLAMLVTIATAVISLLYVPRFAKLQPKRAGEVLRWFWIAQGALVIAVVVMVAGASLFPSFLLLLLGPSYASLTNEVTLAVAGGAAAVLAGSAYSFAAARGVVLNPLVIIPSAVGIQVLLAVLLPVSTVSGVLWLGVLSNLVFWLMNAAYFTVVEKNASRERR